MPRAWIVRLIIAVLVVAAVLLGWKVTRKRAQEHAQVQLPAPDALVLSCPAFRQGEMIPVRYTGDGANVSPPLAWDNVPQGTVSFALVMDDPDARLRTFTHWLICDIPRRAPGLPEGMPAQASITTPIKATQGVNDFREVGYGGPAPPKGGKAHRYFFKLYALDSTLDMAGEFSKLQLRTAMKGHIIAETQLMGRYQRR